MVKNLRHQIESVLDGKLTSDELAINLAEKYVKLEAERVRDPLTGAFNRALIGAVLKREIDLQIKHGQGLAFMMMDLDHFKSVNDKEPDKHQAGDRVLIEFTKILRQVCGMEHALVGRWGGEEFVVVLPQGNAQHLKEVAVDIGESVSGWLAKNAGLVRTKQTVSIGATLAVHNETAVDLIKRTDQLLYQAKERGRNRMALDTGDKIEVVQFK